MTNRETLIAYLTMKVAEQDWHGVADAAMDLRELDAVDRGPKTSANEDMLAALRLVKINCTYDEGFLAAVETAIAKAEA